MDTEYVRRNYSFDVRAEQSERGSILTGRPVVYNSRTDLRYFDEIIMPGALDNTDLTDVRFLVNHNTDMIPLARSRRNNGNSTMQLSVDAEGLSMDYVLLDTENNADARALYSAVERGDISGMSFMFRIDAEEWDNLESDHPTRRILKISHIYEVSAVTFPAYDDTSINARNKEALDNARSVLERARGAVLLDSGLELEKEKTKTILLRR